MLLPVLRICALLMLALLPTNARTYRAENVPPLLQMREADSLRTYLHTLGPMKGYDHFLFDEETASVHLSRYDPATKLLHAGSLQADLERTKVANKRTVKINTTLASANCVRLSFRLYCCESDFLSTQVECFLENRGPFYGQTQNYFKNGTVHSKQENAKLLGKSSMNTHIHTVVEIMASGAGYSVLCMRSSAGSDAVSVQPSVDEMFLDAYLEDGFHLLTLVARNDGLWIRRQPWRSSGTSADEVARLGDHDEHADYAFCATQTYFAIVSSTVEPHDLGCVAMDLQIKVHHRDSGKAFEFCQSILADSERLQLGCGSDTVDIFTVKNGQIRHLVVLLPSTFGSSSVGVPSLCHCNFCYCGMSMNIYSYPDRPYNDTGVNPYDEPDACKGYWSYKPLALDDESSNAAHKWLARARRNEKPRLAPTPQHEFPLSVIVIP